MTKAREDGTLLHQGMCALISEIYALRLQRLRIRFFNAGCAGYSLSFILNKVIAWIETGLMS